MTDQKKGLSYYVDRLRSLKCRCDNKKRYAESFCYSCYKALPKDLRSALYNGLTEGYERAYESAVTWLDENAGGLNPDKSEATE